MVGNEEACGREVRGKETGRPNYRSPRIIIVMIFCQMVLAHVALPWQIVPACNLKQISSSRTSRPAP